MRYISLCSGIEAASVAWNPLGWEPVAFAEIEPYPAAVLAHRFPDVPNLGDVTQVDWSEYHGAADLVVFGSPCQSYSVAGLRQGLDDPRGQLMLGCLAACRDIDPEWVIFENVPGLLSADRGRCFATFLNAVAILWPRGGAAWRVLDASFFRLAQRRRRLFVVVNTRDWRRACEVLLEPESLRGDTAQSKAKREELARADGGSPSTSGITGDGVLTMSSGQANAEITTEDISPTLTCLHEAPIVFDRAAFNQGKGALYMPHIERADVMDTLVARGPHGVCVRIDG